MKGTRVIATLLLVMMVVCAFPVMQVSATENPAYDTIEEALGVEEVKKDVNYQFSGSFTPGTEIMHYTGATHPGRVSYTDDGMSFPAGQPTIWYIKKDTTPFANGTAAVMKMKFGSKSESVNVEINNPNAEGGRAYITFQATAITGYGSKLVEDKVKDYGIGYAIALGTDWFETMVVMKESSYDIYIRNAATNQKWERVMEVAGYRSGKGSGNMSVSTTAVSGTLVKSLQIVAERTEFVYDTIDEVLKVEATATVDYSFDADFVPGAEIMHYTGDTHPGRVSYTDDGMSFPAGQPTIWYIKKNTTPFANGKAAVLKMKFGGKNESVNVEINNPNVAGGRAFVMFQPTAITGYGSKIVDGKAKDYGDGCGASFGTDWFETMIVIKEAGYDIYIKYAATNQKWERVLTINGYRSGKASGNMSVSSTAVSGIFVKSLQVYEDGSRLPGGSAVEAQKLEIARKMEIAKNTTVEYEVATAYNPTMDEYAHIKAITYDGFNYQGKKTKVFAYLGFPEGASASSKVPAMVLIHGGGGHAYLEWVRLWNERGYAAIAMETTGYFPTAPNAGVDESTENKAKNYQYDLGDFAEEGYTLAPKCGNPIEYTEIENQWNFHALTQIILAGNILRQDEKVDNTKIGVTGVSWGGTLTSQVIGIDNRFAFAIPIYGTAYLNDEMRPFENYNHAYVSELWGAEHNLDNATMPIMWYVWNDDHAFGVPSAVKSYNHTAPLNDKTVFFMRNNWAHSHGMVFKVGEAEEHSRIFADWIVKGTGGYLAYEEQPEGRSFEATVDIPAGVTGDIKATLYYITEPMTYSVHNKLGYVTSNHMDQWWQKTTEGIVVDRENGTVSGTIPAEAAGYYINLEFIVDGVSCESSSTYTVVDNLEVTNLQAQSGYSFRVDCQGANGFTGKLIAALYNGKKLEGVQILDVAKTQTITFDKSGCDALKVFWWDDLTKLNIKGRMVELGL